MKRKLYEVIAMKVDAMRRCDAACRDRHVEDIISLVREYLPSGSGVDTGTAIDLDASHGEKLVFSLGFHHMNENGYYCGWYDHQVIVTPSFFGGFSLKITGRDRNQIKEYLADIYIHALSQDIER